MSIYLTPSHAPFSKRNAVHPLQVATPRLTGLLGGAGAQRWLLQALRLSLKLSLGLMLAMLITMRLAELGVRYIPTPTSDVIQTAHR